jgi:lipopolysaccharide export system protein LptA
VLASGFFGLLRLAHAGEDVPGSQKAGASTLTQAEGLRIPSYRNGSLRVELVAAQAEGEVGAAAQLGAVIIRVFEPAEPGDEKRVGPPHLAYRITAKEGEYRFRTGRAELRGDVKVVQFATGGAVKPGTVLSTLRCERAIWKSAEGQLLSESDLHIQRTNGEVLRGTGFVYTLASPDDTRAVRMEVLRDVYMSVRNLSVSTGGTSEGEADSGQATEIRCKGSARFDPEEGAVYFSENVDVVRRGDRMQSDRLRLVLGEAEETGATVVKQLHAKKNVRVTGTQRQAEGSGPATQFTARAEHVVYDAGENVILLKGTEDQLPSVHYGEYWIQDETIMLYRNSGVLTSVGQDREYGEAELHSALGSPGDGKDGSGKAAVTRIRYRERLHYDLGAGVARFAGGVTLKHPQLDLQSAALKVFTREGGSGDGAIRHVQRVVADDEVVIRTSDGRHATAAQAVFDTTAGTLTLTGPPDPVIRQTRQFRVSAPRITSFGPGGEEDATIGSLNTDGPGEMVFFVGSEAREQQAASRTMAWRPDEATRIRYSQSMSYQRSAHEARFDGDVVMSRGELVLESDRVRILLQELGSGRASRVTEHEADDGSELLSRAGLRIQRLVSRGSVQTHASGRHCASDRMVYDVDARTLTLYGNPDAGISARLWEEGGSSLSAQRIVEHQARHEVQADGPGRLTLTERVGLRRLPRSARIRFEGRFFYTAVPNKPATARFRRAVQMRWQDMTVTGDELDTALGESLDVGEALRAHQALGEHEEPGLLRRNLQSAVMHGNVVLSSGQSRRAYADRAEMAAQHAIVELSSEKNAELHDAQGLRLVAPRFVFIRNKALLRANGPGKLFLAAPAKQRSKEGGSTASSEGTVFDDRALPGTHPLDYRLHFGEQMVYSFTDRRIRFDGDVVLQHETVYGRCGQMEALLAADPGLHAEDPEAQPLTLRSAVCRESVFFRRLEPPKEGETLKDVLAAGADKDRPGHTAMVECQRALFDVEENTVTFLGKRPPVRIVEQYVSPSQRVQRTYYEHEKAVLYRETGDVDFPQGQRRWKSYPLPEDGPLRFPD